MNDKDLININKKLETLFKYEKELAEECKRQGQDIEIIKDELNIVKNKINDLENKVGSLYKGYKPAGASYKDFTAEEILQMHKTMSLSQLAEYLHCSISTVQNKIRQARAEMRNL